MKYVKLVVCGTVAVLFCNLILTDARCTKQLCTYLCHSYWEKRFPDVVFDRNEFHQVLRHFYERIDPDKFRRIYQATWSPPTPDRFGRISYFVEYALDLTDDQMRSLRDMTRFISAAYSGGLLQNWNFATGPTIMLYQQTSHIIQPTSRHTTTISTATTTTATTATTTTTTTTTTTATTNTTTIIAAAITDTNTSTFAISTFLLVFVLGLIIAICTVLIVMVRLKRQKKNKQHNHSQNYYSDQPPGL